MRVNIDLWHLKLLPLAFPNNGSNKGGSLSLCLWEDDEVDDETRCKSEESGFNNKVSSSGRPFSTRTNITSAQMDEWKPLIFRLVTR